MLIWAGFFCYVYICNTLNLCFQRKAHVYNDVFTEQVCNGLVMIKRRKKIKLSTICASQVAALKSSDEKKKKKEDPGKQIKDHKNLQSLLCQAAE